MHILIVQAICFMRDTLFTGRLATCWQGEERSAAQDEQGSPCVSDGGKISLCCRSHTRYLLKSPCVRPPIAMNGYRLLRAAQCGLATNNNRIRLPKNLALQRLRFHFHLLLFKVTKNFTVFAPVVAGHGSSQARHKNCLPGDHCLLTTSRAFYWTWNLD